jgi:hypothetical protein
VRGARWLLPLLPLALCGCQIDVSLSHPAGTGAPAPPCVQPPGQVDGSMVLLAQSVPTAQQLPCLRHLPEGWGVGGFHARKGRGQLWLVVGKENRRALTVTLTRRCDLGGASETQSDVDGASRFDETRSSGPFLRGTRSYVFPGSCLTYDYSFVDGTALPVLSTSIGTVERAEVAARVAEDSRGALKLDPPPGRSS